MVSQSLRLTGGLLQVVVEPGPRPVVLLTLVLVVPPRALPAGFTIVPLLDTLVVRLDVEALGLVVSAR